MGQNAVGLSAGAGEIVVATSSPATGLTYMWDCGPTHLLYSMCGDRAKKVGPSRLHIYIWYLPEDTPSYKIPANGCRILCTRSMIIVGRRPIKTIMMMTMMTIVSR